jgi:hypothetical protein
MKTAKAIVFLGVIICLGILCGLGCGRSEMTKTRAIEMFDKVGGVDKVNQEAKVIFDRFGTNNPDFLSESDLKDFPAISALGNSVGTFPQPTVVTFHQSIKIDFPPHIRVRRGLHSNTMLIFIFEPNKVTELKDASSFVQVTSNIFVTK